jgi:hypothetical protein
LAWAIAYGTWPQQIDHQDRIRNNNRLDNLRLATASQNSLNRGVRKNNTSGFKGVSYAKQTGKWWARIVVNGSRQSLGLFNSAEEAARAYKAAEALHHKEWGIYT